MEAMVRSMITVPTPAASLGTTIGYGTVRVHLFASLRDRHGWSERSVPLTEAETTVAALQQQLHIGGPNISCAVNHQFAPPRHMLHPGDEVAFLPPISGG